MVALLLLVLPSGRIALSRSGSVSKGLPFNPKIDDLITAAGFWIVELKRCYLPGRRPMTYTYQGFAEKGFRRASI